MPNYEEIIQQSQANVKALSVKLKELDKLHEDINKLIQQPEIFEAIYQQIVKLSEDYTNSLGASVKKYLDGNNSMFTEKLKEFSNRNSELQKEITRLINADFNKLFHDLQKAFIDQTRKDLAEELKKFDNKSQDLQKKIDELKQQVDRLERIDIDKHFDKLQKTLSDIFGAINGISITLTALTQTLAGIVQTLGAIQNTVDNNHREVKHVIGSFSEATSKHLRNQDNEAKRNVELLESKIKSLSDQNDLLKKEIKANRIILVVGLTINLIFLIYVAVKH